MNWTKTLTKAGLGILTFIASLAVANSGFLTGLLPENIAKMTVGGALAAIIVGVANWLKHKND